MIRSIYFERYKKVLIAACLLVIGLSIFNAINQTNQWKAHSTDPYAKEQYEQNQQEATYYDKETNKTVSYSSFEDYRKTDLLFYYSANYGPTAGPKNLSDANNYATDVLYYTRFSTNFYASLILIVPLLGFLLFFIDQKTGFNQFLFSLGRSRKELFKKKFLYVALPFLLSILIGQSLYALMIHTLIPAPYMNATLGQLFYSVLNNFCLLFVMFCSSAFIGSMVGNVFFGPLTWFVYWILLILFPNGVYALVNNINLATGSTMDSPRTLFIIGVGKTGGYWWLSLLFIMLGLLFTFWGYKKFQKLSLESDSAYLLHSESRWSIWSLMTLFTSLVLVFNFFDPWNVYLTNHLYGDKSIGLIQPIFSSSLLVLIVGCVCSLLIFFPQIKRFIANSQRKWRLS